MPFGASAAQARVSKVFNAIAPLGGLDDIDPIANMDPKFCIQLINWFPGNAALQARQGYMEWAINLGLPVRTILPFYEANGDYNLFAATDGGIYDVKAQTSAPVLVQATTNGYYKFVNYGDNVYNQHLIMVNGQGVPSLMFNGTAWITMTREDVTPDTPGEIGGVDPSTFSHVAIYQRRLWFVEKDSMTAWYLPVDALAGTAKPFYLRGVFKRGGKLLYMINWSVDGGNGVDDKLVFVSTAGEVAVYAGTDPAEADLFKLQAVFYAAPPVGERAFVDFGGDVLMVTTNGLIPLTKILMGLMSEAPYEQALTKRISRTLNRLILSRRYQLNWEVLNMPTLQSIVVFVPPNGQEPPIQFVMNVLTGAWTRFDLPANCACLALGDMYFGTTDGRVMKYGGEEYLDEIKIVPPPLPAVNGRPIECFMFSSYTYMEDPTSLKHWKLVRPLFQSQQPPSYLIHLNTDYKTDGLPGAPTAPVQGFDDPLWGPWPNAAIWDQSFWSSVFTSYAPWIGTDALGFCCAVLLKVLVDEPTSLVAMKFVYEPGGVV